MSKRWPAVDTERHSFFTATALVTDRISTGREKDIMERESISYLMLFCALVVKARNRATLEEAMTLAPVTGGAGLLAGELLRQANAG